MKAAVLESGHGPGSLTEQSLNELRARMGDVWLSHRLRVQVDTLVRLAGMGRGGFHWENVGPMFQLLALALRALGLAGAGAQNAWDLRVVQHRLPIAGLPRAFHNMRVLHLSDLHMDACEGFAEHMARVVSQQQFELCVLTGDYRFLDKGRYHQLGRPLQVLAPALQCERGVYAVLGNHDYLEMVPSLQAAGVRVLLNEAAPLYGADGMLWLVGLDDAHLYGDYDFRRALRDVPEAAKRILLVHSPELIPEAASLGFDAYLTGHTHGGQVCWPGGRPLIVHARCARKYVAGPWQFGAMRGYTSRGVGSSGVFARFFCPPEIVIHQLVSAPPAAMS